MKLSALSIISISVAIAAVFSCALAAPAQEGVTYPGEIVYAVTGAAVVFSHKKHVEDFGLACDDCHGAIFEVRAFAARARGDFNMASLSSGKYCGACHNGNKAFGLDDSDQCARCHSGGIEAPVTGVVRGPKEPIQLGSGDNIAAFPHEKHGKLSCDRCHTELFPMKKTKTITTMDDINAKKSCGKCHNGKTAFDASDCGKCHPKM